MRAFSSVLLAVLLSLHAGSAQAQDATSPREITTPNPTIEHISIEWAIGGDANEDGVVTVRYREMGAGAFREGHPLFRRPAGSNTGFSWVNAHSGSLFGLAPGTAYEIELQLSDPDGGDSTQTVMASTRPVPVVADGAPRTAVTPGTLSGALRAASPGDVLVLGPGTYDSFTVGNDGSPGSPIVVMGESAADVIVNGEVRMDGRSHVWIRNLTVNGQIKFNNSVGIVVEGCVVNTDRNGLVAYASGTRDGYFADNVITGPTVWRLSALGASGDNLGEGIELTGPGNVIINNRVARFRDCVSLLEDSGANEQFSIDIIGNDLSECADDAIEADFAMGNVRVLRNRSTNSFIAWSSQPGLGGPTYFIRNVAFANFFQVFKPNRGSLGDVLYHNTVVKQGDALGVFTGDSWGRTVTRNNIFIGGPDEVSTGGFSTGPGRILSVRSLDTATSDFNYDGFGSIEVGRFDGRFGDTAFATFAELTSLTTETNAVMVDLSIFDAAIDHPRTMFPALSPPDLRLTAGAAAVDVGVVLPNINDGFSGTAPDIGAYELGGSLPPYGPRTGGPVCGNGAVEAGEACDDGNTTTGDGCDAVCQVEGMPPGDSGMPPGDGGMPPPGDGGGIGSDRSPDGGPGGGTGGDGCGCDTFGTSRSSLVWMALVVVWFLRRRRKS